MTSTREFLTLICVLGLASGCGTSEKHSETSASKSPVAVRVTTVEKLNAPSYSKLLGSIEARNRAEIQTKIQARVDKIPVVIGDLVRKGDLLIEFDTRDTGARVKQARAVHDQAEQDLQRFKTLLDQGAATQQEYDGVRAREAVAAAGLQEAEAMLSYARITAPISGTVTRKDINEGDFAVPGRPLFVIEDQSSLRLSVSLPESQRAQFDVGDSFWVSLSAAGEPVLGVIEELSPSADPLSRSLISKLSLAQDGRMHPGQTAHLLLPDTAESGLTLPSEALVQRGQLVLVYCVGDDGTVSLRLVRTGQVFGNRTEILSGVKIGERVVISPPASLEDHDPVEVQP